LFWVSELKEETRKKKEVNFTEKLMQTGIWDWCLIKSLRLLFHKICFDKIFETSPSVAVLE